MSIKSFLSQMDAALEKGFVSEPEIQAMKGLAIYKWLMIFAMKRSADFDFYYQNIKGDYFKYRIDAPEDQRKELVLYFKERNP
jgi:hypothetical protein